MSLANRTSISGRTPTHRALIDPPIRSCMTGVSFVARPSRVSGDRFCIGNMINQHVLMTRQHVHLFLVIAFDWWFTARRGCRTPIAGELLGQSGQDQAAKASARDAKVNPHGTAAFICRGSTRCDQCHRSCGTVHRPDGRKQDFRRSTNLK